MRSYIKCKRAINAHDSWHCEIESCTLMPIWKMFGKNTYLKLKLQYEYIEKMYNNKRVSAVTREIIMRVNGFCVLQSGLAVAFDKQVENYNRILKQAPPTTALDVAVMRSWHAIIGEKAVHEMCGLARTGKNIRGTSNQRGGRNFAVGEANEFGGYLFCTRTRLNPPRLLVESRDTKNRCWLPARSLQNHGSV